MDYFKIKEWDLFLRGRLSLIAIILARALPRHHSLRAGGRLIVPPLCWTQIRFGNRKISRCANQNRRTKCGYLSPIALITITRFAYLARTLCTRWRMRSSLLLLHLSADVMFDNIMTVYRNSNSRGQWGRRISPDVPVVVLELYLYVLTTTTTANG